METGTAKGKPLKPESVWKKNKKKIKKKNKHTLPVKVLPYLDFFFLASSVNALSKTLSHSIAIFD